MASPLENFADEQLTLVKCCLCAGQLRDPLQLDCLHNCCKVCAEQQLAAPAVPVGTGDAAAAAVNNDAAEPASPGSINCPICQEMTDGGRLTVDLFIDLHVRSLSIMSGRPWCDFCPTPRGNKEVMHAELAEAEALCFGCSKLLCSTCLRQHRRSHGTHVLRALDENLNWEDVAEHCYPPCPRHGESIQYACLSCESLGCGTCASECTAIRHDIQKLHSAPVCSIANLVKRDVDSFGMLLVHIADLRQRQKTHTFYLKDVRREGLEVLRRNKDAVLDAVRRAHQKAEKALHDGCEELEQEADEQAAAATARLHDRASHANLVGRCVINSKHAAAAFSKRKHIAKRLGYLTAELNRLDPPEDKERCVRYIEMQGGQLPDEVELDGMLEYLIGQPKLVRCTNLVEYAYERRNHSERIKDKARHEQHEQNEKKEVQQHQAEINKVQPCIELPAFSDPTSPSLSKSDSYGATSLSPTSDTVVDLPSLTLPTSPDDIEPSSKQYKGGTKRRQWVKRQRKDFVLKCSDCGAHVTDSVNLRILSAEAAEDERQIILHHMVIDMEFPSRVRLHRHWKPSFIGKTADSGFVMTKEYMLSCKKCSNDWGVCAMIQKKYFFIIKIDTLEVSADGVVEKVKRWVNLPYKLKFIWDRDLLNWGHETIPDEYPLPNRWYKAASSQIPK